MLAPSAGTPSRDRSFIDSTVAREWYGQLALAARTPGLAQHLVDRMGELLPRFAAYYEKLRVLPRRVRRALARRLPLAGVALLLALCGGSVEAAKFSVDEVTCHLADAITAANTDTATGGCPAGSGNDLLVLDADVVLGSALPSLQSSMRINAGLGSILDGAGHSCLVVDATGNVRIDGLTVRNCVAGEGGGVLNRGRLVIANTTLSGNTAANGGGVRNRGRLRLTNAIISENAATSYGGGVSNLGTLTIAGSEITGNTAPGGAGIHNDYGTVRISNTTISGNTANGAFPEGGGVFNYGGRMTLTECTISGNTAGRGGGLINGFYFTPGFGPAIIEIQRSTISGNTATTGVGGGVMLYQRGALIVAESTISGNTAATTGGGVSAETWYEEGFLTVENSTISGNEAAEEGGGIHAQSSRNPAIVLDHALVSGNAAPVGPSMSFEGSLSVALDDFNLFGSDGDAGLSGVAPGPSDIVPAPGVLVEDILAPLGDNGGPTLTHALVPGSPAVDAIPTSETGCLGTRDQRGFERPSGVGCDVGSFELGAAPIRKRR